MREPMTTALFYFFVFSTWGVGISAGLAAVKAFSEKSKLANEEKKMEIAHKKEMVEKINSLGAFGALMGTMSAPTGQAPAGVKNTPWGNVSDVKPSAELIPEKIRELMQSSPNHPEVKEIDGDDQILGVRFEAKNYPPVFGDEDE